MLRTKLKAIADRINRQRNISGVRDDSYLAIERDLRVLAETLDTPMVEQAIDAVTERS